MTVDELIERLESLSKRGFGDSNVEVSNDAGDSSIAETVLIREGFQRDDEPVVFISAYVHAG